MNSPPIKYKKHLLFSILSASVGAAVGAVVMFIQHDALSVSEEGTLTCEPRYPPGTVPSVSNYLFPPHSPCNIIIGGIATSREKSEQSAFSIPDLQLPDDMLHSLGFLNLHNSIRYEYEKFMQPVGLHPA